MSEMNMDKRTRQRKAMHRRRLAYGRALHQIVAMRHKFMVVWNRYARGKGPKPERIKIPYMLKQHKVRLYRAFTGV